MAPEGGHQLLNYEGSSLPRGEYVGPLEQYNLMFAFDDKSPRSVIWPKRIWAQQRDTILLAPWTEDLSP
jgi:hypothetical protein